ncbi:hypothetical protein W97_09172 [Coniosporium apollinis CBS 100218]|uniref:CHAT domain-containing protein n=1 Tax=Coniosporium apollinis (strain CBS 100218) TaxID=1168221 RepID=R7Z723_CONA1|nr:uncharacterized protein W97_09172 [Coniosporium apollinis CBS 100218]EON69908.1 hypothetical protein W97_09172 [Coniosporium apollinis CBS 100218]
MPELYDLLLYRGAETLTLDRLEGMFGPQKDAICVDWVMVGESIWMFTVRAGEQPEAHELDISLGKVSSWIKGNLKAEALRRPNANDRMRKLDALVAPLATASKKEELLIFCPAGMLGALPLHALQIDGNLILERNPVVYSSSLAVLQHCLLRRSDRSDNGREVTIIGNPKEDLAAAEESVNAVSKRFNTQPLLGSAATKSAFEDKAGSTAIFHYHGHAYFKVEDPLSSAFKMNDTPLTARIILSLRLVATLFVMIACESAQQDIQIGEEPIGLLPMLLLAGTNAAVGTLWRCSDSAGKEFTEAFYDGMLLQIKETSPDPGKDSLVDIAKALRNAALEVRKKRPAPYFWALFVMHGNWQCSRRSGWLVKD